MYYRWVLFTSLLGLNLLLNTGCPALLVGGAAGAGTVAYVTGELKSTEEVPINRAWKATQNAMKDLGFAIETTKKDAFYCQLTAKTARDKKVNVRLERQSERLTSIRIRVGMFGDQSLSMQILQKIRKEYS